MHRPTIALILLAFAAGSLLRCDIGAPVWADDSTDEPGDPPLRSGARLKALTRTSPDGASQFVGWFDAELGIRCAPATTTSGDRCMPIQSSADFHFLDPECTEPGFVVSACEFTGELFTRIQRQWPNAGEGCNPSFLYEVYELGDQVELDAVYRVIPGQGCVIDEWSPPARHLYFRKGDRVPDEEFQPFEVNAP